MILIRLTIAVTRYFSDPAIWRMLIVPDMLPCPKCECHAVSVYFTRPTTAEYHTWFTCSNCDFSMRAQNSGKPEFYTQERDRTGKKAVAASGEPKQ